MLVNPQSVLLREPGLLIPGKAPVGPVKIDREHPIGTRVIDGVYNNQVGPTALDAGHTLNGVPITTDGTSEFVKSDRSPYGPYTNIQQGSGGSGGALMADAPSLLGSANLDDKLFPSMFLVVQRRNLASGIGGYLLSSATLGPFNLGINSADYFFIFYNGMYNNIPLLAGEPSDLVNVDEVPQTYVFSINNGLMQIFRNGVKKSEFQLNMTGSLKDLSGLLSIQGGFGYAASGQREHYFTAIGSGPLSETEARDLSINPYQILTVA